MFSRAGLVVALAALVVPSSAMGEVTIKVGGGKGVTKYREVFYPETFRVKGKTGDYRGPVALEVDEFPYDGGGEVATAETDGKGEYVFPKVRLSRNAKLRVRAGTEFSAPLEVYVHPGLKAKTNRVGPDHDRVVATYTGHPSFAPPENALFVYIRKDRERRLIRLGGERRLTRIGDGVWRYIGRVRLPAGNYRYSLIGCVRGLSAAGYGRAWRIDRSCGDRVIPFPNWT